MSNTINLVLPFNDKNVELVKSLLAKADLTKKVNDIEVTDAEEVGETAPAKTPAKRASRAKPKPEPEEEEETEEEFDLDGDEAPEEEGITLDDIKLVQAKKVTEHRAKIIEMCKKLNCTGLSSLKEADYQKYYDFLVKLK